VNGKTKIICTIGPASDKEDILRDMMLAGMDVARLNFSHGTHADHLEKIRLIEKLRGELSSHTSVMLDTKGPQIRLGDFENGKVNLKSGAKFVLYGAARLGDEGGIGITYPGLCRDVKPGDTILVSDGLIELRVDETDDTDISCTVINGGVLSNHKSVNVPGVRLSIPFLSDADRADLKFGAENGVDFVAASFVQCAENVREIRLALDEYGGKDIKIIAKIENAAGVENCDEIIAESDGIMVARGDMGVEVPIETIPGIQKRLIDLASDRGKIVITATQMLESMTANPRPTRAEITDVANAIYDGTSAIMLSGETASGMYPVQSVITMQKIALRTESEIDYRKRFNSRENRGRLGVPGAIAHATCMTAHDLDAAAIVTVTEKGTTAQLVSSYRPSVPIVGCSHNAKTCRYMSLMWGITPVLIGKASDTDELLSFAVEAAEKNGFAKAGEIVAITAGIPLGISGTTNMIKVQTVTTDNN